MPDVFDKQVTADRAQGYDYVGYHSYAKRRYNELVGGERWIWRSEERRVGKECSS